MTILRTLRRHWMPASILLVGALSFGLLVWLHRINEQQRAELEICDAIMDIEKTTASAHLWLEQLAAGDTNVDIGEIKRDIDIAVTLGSSIVNGGPSEHGQLLQPLRDEGTRRKVQDLLASIQRFKTIAFQRVERPDTAGTGLDQRLDAVFRNLMRQAESIEDSLEKSGISIQASRRRLVFSVLLTWACVLIGAVVAVWVKDVKRLSAERALGQANESLQSQARELQRHQERLEDLVEERTAELTHTIRALYKEMAEREQTEQFLRASDSRFRTLVENLPVSMFLKNPDSFYLYCNDRCAQELDGVEVVGKKDSDLYPKELAEKYLAEDKRIVESGKTVEIDEHYQKDGRELLIHKIKLPVRGEDGEISGILGISWDITERVRLESIAEAANLMENIGYIFSGIRHEIGNPINSIKMTLGILEKRLDSTPMEAIRKYVGWMLAELSKIEYLLKALKNFNLYETPELQKVSMKSFFEGFLSLVAGDFEEKHIRIEMSIRPEAAQGLFDPRALQQVMLNVMTNAADALVGRDNPTIAVAVSREEGRIEIAVKDNGRGMSDEQQKDLFKPFRTTKAGGTGLGLVIAKKMLAAMNGAIEVHSTEGRGTTVHVYIPRYQG